MDWKQWWNKRPNRRDVKIGFTIAAVSSVLTLFVTFTQGHVIEGGLLVLAGKFAAAAESPTIVAGTAPEAPVLLSVTPVKAKPRPKPTQKPR